MAGENTMKIRTGWTRLSSALVRSLRHSATFCLVCSTPTVKLGSRMGLNAAHTLLGPPVAFTTKRSGFSAFIRDYLLDMAFVERIVFANFAFPIGPSGPAE